MTQEERNILFRNYAPMWHREGDKLVFNHQEFSFEQNKEHTIWKCEVCWSYLKNRSIDKKIVRVNFSEDPEKIERHITYAKKRLLEKGIDWKEEKSDKVYKLSIKSGLLLRIQPLYEDEYMSIIYYQDIDEL